MKKNLIILTVDEMRGDCLGANGDQADIRTPHMDALAARGVNFQRHFTTFPKCVPARISLTTGRYTHTDGFRDIYNHLPASRPDLMSTLISSGYECVLFGKNHCWENIFEASHQPPELPPGAEGLRLSAHSWTSGYKEMYETGESAFKETAPPLHPPQFTRARRKFQDDVTAEQAVHFLTRPRDRTRPFYLHVNFNHPHPSYEVEEPWYSMYDRDSIAPFPDQLPENAPESLRWQREVRLGNQIDGHTLREIQATYFGMISKVDDLLGRITRAMDHMDLWRDSVVVFLSDHGDFAGQYGIWEKWDTTFSDCLTRVPFVLVDPDLPSGRVFPHLSDHTDLAPTLCDLLGLTPLPGVQGRNLLPILNGKRPPRQSVFANGGHERESRRRVFDPFKQADPEHQSILSDKQKTYLNFPDSMARAKMVRSLTHKLVFRETGDHELYDLTSDPWELKNRFHDPALRDVREDLLMKLLEWGLQTDTDFPKPHLVSA